MAVRIYIFMNFVFQTVVEVIDGISESRDVTDSYEGVVMSAQGNFSDPTVPESCHKLLVFLSDRDILIIGSGRNAVEI